MIDLPQQRGGHQGAHYMVSLRIYGIASAFIEITTYGVCVRFYATIISISVQVNADMSNILEYILRNSDRISLEHVNTILLHRESAYF